MCGICAYIGAKTSNNLSAMDLALDQLHHRGPDARATLQGDNYVLGQTRLEIVGKDLHGAQPMRHEHFTFVFNGELHNYKELAAQLAVHKQEFDQHSDSSVAFAALRHWGMDALPKFRGFWAFIFVDENSQTAYCARDRYGQKPLLYTQTDTATRLASEASALGVDLQVEENTLLRFLREAQYPAAPQTFFKNVWQVEPGTVLSISLLDGRQTVERYYHSASQPASSLSLKEAAVAFAEKLNDSLELRLRADVPIALLLSAGKDSGTLHQLLGPQRQLPAYTYSNGTLDDEAAEVMKWYGDERAIEIVQPHVKAIHPEQLDAIHRTLDAPMASASLLALDALYAHAHARGTPVVLSGQGADEVLGGYHYYSQLQHNKAIGFVSRLADFGSVARLLAARKDLRAARAVFEAFPQNPLSSNHPRDRPAPNPQLDSITARRIQDLGGAQLQTMLWYEDRLSMRHSIETRCPFLDVELVEFCLSLPGQFFVNGFQRKRLLTLAFGASWPLALQKQKRKRGLPAAETTWIFNNQDSIHEGVEIANRFFGVQRSAQQIQYSNLGEREAKAIFRLSMAGYWLRQLGLG